MHEDSPMKASPEASAPVAEKRAGFPQKTTGSPEPIPGRCGAKLKYTDPPRYCKKWPLNGRRRCHRCGGRSKVGPDAPRFKDGRTSKYAYLTPHTFQALQTAVADERALMDLTDDIGLLEVCKQDAALDWTVGATAEGWKRIGATVRRLVKAREAGDDKAVDEAIERLATLAKLGDRAGARDALAETIERKGKLVTARQRLQIAGESLIPAMRVGLVLSGVAQLIKEFVPDVEKQAEFRRRFVGFLGPRLLASSGAKRGILVDPAGSGPGRDAGRESDPDDTH